MEHSARFEKLCEDARANVREVSIETVDERLKRRDAFTLVDVREESEFAAARIPGAVHIGRGVLERDVEKKIPDSNADVVLYCGGGYRSALAAESLGKMGYRNVSSMAGGFRAWKTAKLPLE